MPFPRGQRSVEPVMSLNPEMPERGSTPPNLPGRSSDISRNHTGLGSSSNPLSPKCLFQKCSCRDITSARSVTYY